MIIPTLRILRNSQYEKIINVYKKSGIHSLRVNMTRHSLPEYIQHIRFFQNEMPHLKIFCDIPVPGEKIRLALPLDSEFHIEENHTYTFTSKKGEEEFKENPFAIPVGIDSFPNMRMSEIIIGDGEAIFRITNSNAHFIEAVATGNSIVRGHRSIIIPHALEFRPAQKNQLEEYIEAFKEIKPYAIILSFSEAVSVVQEIDKTISSALGYHPVIIPKIETPLGVNSLEKITAFYPNVLIGRGDLALTDDIDRYYNNYRKALSFHNPPKVNLIVATDILSSLYENTIPSRADLTDLMVLKECGIKDIVASAGISIDPDLFALFYQYSSHLNE